jgi:hypothetical protein
MKRKPCDCKDPDCYYVIIGKGYYSKYCLDGECYCDRYKDAHCDLKRFRKDQKKKRKEKR